MKPSLPIPPAFGPRLSTSRAALSPLSINSSCAITSNGSSGRKPRRAPNCLRRWSPPLVPSTGRPIGSWQGASWISGPAPHIGISLEGVIVKDQLEGLVTQMVERGILFDEAVGEFEKRFIKRILDRANG